jgi:hypothetical protein
MRVTLSPTWNLCEGIAGPVFAQRNIVNATTTYAAEQRDEVTTAFSYSREHDYAEYNSRLHKERRRR